MGILRGKGDWGCRQQLKGWDQLGHTHFVTTGTWFWGKKEDLEEKKLGFKGQQWGF